MAANALPDLTAYDAVLFDLDGVLTPTAEVHMHAWQTMFEELFAAWDITPPYTERDYFEYLDGKKRYDGVASLLRSRDVEVPWGHPSDPLEADTVCGIGNRKNAFFERVLRERGDRPVPGLARAARPARRRRHPGRGGLEFEERREVLRVAGLRDRFDVVMDGVIAERDHLALEARSGRVRRGGTDAGRRARAQRRRRRRAERRAVGRRRAASGSSSASTAASARRCCATRAPTSSSSDLKEFTA